MQKTLLPLVPSLGTDPHSPHNSRKFSVRTARNANSTRCFIASIYFHGICSSYHKGPKCVTSVLNNHRYPGPEPAPSGRVAANVSLRITRESVADSRPQLRVG